MLNQDFLNKIRSMGIDFRLEEPMNLHTSFRIGGNADCLIEVQSAEFLRKLLSACSEYAVPYFVLGLGSNLLVSDKGIRGVVIKLDGDFNKITMEDDCTVRCGAGVSLAKLCNFAAVNSLGGLEFAWGIPGSVGGAIYMNAGAYGGEIKDVVISSCYTAPDGDVGVLIGKENDFSYRHSYYSDKKLIITEAKFKLYSRPSEDIFHQMQEIMDKRKSKQPLNRPSAGSAFKRPKDNSYAAALIEECGLKGFHIGGAQVSEKHSGFIINQGFATAEDVKELIQYIQKTVLEQKKIALEPEIKFVGEN